MFKRFFKIIETLFVKSCRDFNGNMIYVIMLFRGSIAIINEICLLKSSKIKGLLAGIGSFLGLIWAIH